MGRHPQRGLRSSGARTGRIPRPWKARRPLHLGRPFLPPPLLPYAENPLRAVVCGGQIALHTT